MELSLCYKSSTFSPNIDLNLNSTFVVDPNLEYIDPTPDIQDLMTKFNKKFFNGALSGVKLEWSKNMYSCAGICYFRKDNLGSSCTIRLSEPLLKLRPRKDLVETLLHEMIHAFNFANGIIGENGGHGQHFLSKMHEINKRAGTKIDVYHNFHDEVDFYKIHWWRCDGACRDRRPYYGYVKKIENVEPGPHNKWWKTHAETCKGSFVKVKGPDLNDKDPRKSLPAPSKSSSNVPIMEFIDLTLEEPIKIVRGPPIIHEEVIVIDDDDDEVYVPPTRSRKSVHENIRREMNDDSVNIVFIDDEFLGDENLIHPEDSDERTTPETINCPVCDLELQEIGINEHLDECLLLNCDI